MIRYATAIMLRSSHNSGETRERRKKVLGFLIQQTRAPSGAIEPEVAAHDADVVPHHATQLVTIVRNEHPFLWIARAAVTSHFWHVGSRGLTLLRILY